MLNPVKLLEKEQEPVPTEKPSAQLSDDEIATWEAIFKQRGKNGGNEIKEGTKKVIFGRIKKTRKYSLCLF